MKKIIYATILGLTMQFGFAQSPDAETFVTNMGVKTQIEGAKQQILPTIIEEKLEEFNKEFDALATSFVTDFTKLIDENYDVDELKKANVTFAEKKELAQILPKDTAVFEEKVNTLQIETGMMIQSIIAKYGKPNALNTEE
ncbi:hypothetical protein P3875_08875 [Myroides sp. JBRI-B21084]|uniref:hypothetical protein n=1 Tax=Myroides sp. JBRI-B21084 TaxID=3119977 RepID=UPI0026E1B22D|nr:hypothetical protein [Paenimyroides cloacae]WKW45889.1 hypothetical protein P3875_08875 [Paenimyroides cloacae]